MWLVICFKGQGKRIPKEEGQQYDKDINIQWDPKAWYNSRMHNKYATSGQPLCWLLWTVDIMPKSEGPHLVLCDNLQGQTTEEWKKLLKKHCTAELHSLIACWLRG